MHEKSVDIGSERQGFLSCGSIFWQLHPDVIWKGFSPPIWKKYRIMTVKMMGQREGC